MHIRVFHSEILCFSPVQTITKNFLFIERVVMQVCICSFIKRDNIIWDEKSLNVLITALLLIFRCSNFKWTNCKHSRVKTWTLSKKRILYELTNDKMALFNGYLFYITRREIGSSAYIWHILNKQNLYKVNSPTTIYRKT